MKLYIFFKEDNDFSDILDDNNLKKLFRFKISWSQHLMLGSNETTDELNSYIVLKYGESLLNERHLFKDRTPQPNIDYIVKRK